MTLEHLKQLHNSQKTFEHLKSHFIMFWVLLDWVSHVTLNSCSQDQLDSSDFPITALSPVAAHTHSQLSHISGNRASMCAAASKKSKTPEKIDSIQLVGSSIIIVLDQGFTPLASKFPGSGQAIEHPRDPGIDVWLYNWQWYEKACGSGGGDTFLFSASMSFHYAFGEDPPVYFR